MSQAEVLRLTIDGQACTGKPGQTILDVARAHAIDQRVADTAEHVELLLTRYEWADATHECDRLLRLFPTHPEARRLPDKIVVARDGHKRELLKMWKEAVTRDDVDRSLELLRELDQYLSTAEAEAYKESARDVFRKKLQQLGVQFALHVHDKSWAEALRIGRQITDEFPNTRMAAEVRERLPILAEKAQTPAVVPYRGRPRPLGVHAKAQYRSTAILKNRASLPSWRCSKSHVARRLRCIPSARKPPSWRHGRRASV